MISTLIAAILSVTSFTGYALYYNPGKMERVYQIRVNQGLVPAGWRGGLAAVPDCKELGNVVYAKFKNPQTKQWSPYRGFLVVDCAQPRDYKMQVKSGRAIEVDYKSAAWAGFTGVGRTGATVVRNGGLLEH